jgi:hypothetical protein
MIVIKVLEVIKQKSSMLKDYYFYKQKKLKNLDACLLEESMIILVKRSNVNLTTEKPPDKKNKKRKVETVAFIKKKRVKRNPSKQGSKEEKLDLIERLEHEGSDKASIIKVINSLVNDSHIFVDLFAMTWRILQCYKVSTISCKSKEKNFVHLECSKIHRSQHHRTRSKRKIKG